MGPSALTTALFLLCFFGQIEAKVTEDPSPFLTSQDQFSAGAFEASTLGETSGSTKNPAQCAPEGSLQCSQVTTCTWNCDSATRTQTRNADDTHWDYVGSASSSCDYTDCEDTRLMSSPANGGPRFWVHSGNAGCGFCAGFASATATQRYILSTRGDLQGKTFPGEASDTMVLTKPFTFHPNRAGKSIGVYGFKRLRCKVISNGRHCDLYQTAICVDCKNTAFEFSKTEFPGGNQPQQELQNFVTQCLPSAFKDTPDADGNAYNDGFQCTGDDVNWAQAYIAAM